MLTPFDEKSPLARTLDHLAVQIALVFASVFFSLSLYRRPIPGLIAACALYIMLLALLHRLRRARLEKKQSALRRQIGGALAMEALSLMEPSEADLYCARTLSELCALEIAPEQPRRGVLCRLEGERILVRCAQKAPGEAADSSDVLAALRDRNQTDAQRVVLCTTTHFDARAVSFALEHAETIRLMDASDLAAACGRAHPASDEQLAALKKRKRGPFAWPRLKQQIFSPAKKKRYLLFAFVLLIVYLLSKGLCYFFAALLSFLFALGAHRAARAPFRL